MFKTKPKILLRVVSNAMLLFAIAAVVFSLAVPAPRAFAQETFTQTPGGTGVSEVGVSGGQLEVGNTPSLGSTDQFELLQTESFGQTGTAEPGATSGVGISNPGVTGAAGQPGTGGANPPPGKVKTVGCWSMNGLLPRLNIDACVANMAYLVLWIVSWILWLSGKILDISIHYTLRFQDLLNNVPVVDIGWKIFRDLANICFIFVLLWIAISTILGLQSGKTKELLAHLIIVALLINFSLFITKAVVDASNIVAIHFYTLITRNEVRTDTATTWYQKGLSLATPDNSFSGAFMEGLKIQTLYDSQTAGGKAIDSSTGIEGFAKKYGTYFAGHTLNFGKIILIAFFGSFLMITAAYVFFVAAILFVVRAVVLMFVMILSPLAFLAFILPATESYAEQWKEALIKQSLFAPIYLALSFVVVKAIQSEAFTKVMSVSTASDTIASAFSGSSTSGVAIIVNFIILIALMLGCIFVAKKMEAYGHEAAIEIGKTARGFIGRQIVRGTYVTGATSTANYGAKFAGSVMQSMGFKAGADKIRAWGKRVDEKGEKIQKTIDVNELDKKFRRSAFGATALGEAIREKTTGGKIFGTQAKFGAEKSVREAYEEDERLRNRRFAIQKAEDAENSLARLKIAEMAKLPGKPNWQDKKYRNDDGTLNPGKFDSDFKKFTDTFEPKRENYETGTAGDTEFAAAKKMFDGVLARKPNRSTFTDEASFATAQEKYEKIFDEPPEKANFVGLPPEAYARAKKIYDDREKNRDARVKAADAERAALGYALNQVTPEEFANMDEHRIKDLAHHANLRQLKAVMASTDWTVEEKQKMLGVRWETEINEFKDFSEKVIKPYKEALDKLYGAMKNKQLEVDEAGVIQDKRDDGSDQTEINPADGKKYAILLDGSKLLMPTEPELPGHLKGWARNKMTKEEYELAASVKPELFDNPDLIHVIRWGLTNKEFRTDENMDYNLRDRMTYMKDSELDVIVEKANHPNYIAEDDDVTRKAAFDAAEKAAEAARVAGKSAEEVEKIFRKIYARGTANDTIRRKISVAWADGRAPNEIAGARGRNRNSKAVHRLVDEGIFQHFKEKDSEDIKELLKHVLEDYRAEEKGEGLVTDENRKLLRYLFTDPRSRSITRPIAKLDADLQNLYRKLETEGNYNPANKITFKSDVWRK